MFKRNIPFVFFVYIVQMVVGMDIYLLASHWVAGWLAFPATIRRKTPNAFLFPHSLRVTKPVLVSWLPLFLIWSNLLYVACFVPAFDSAPLAPFSPFARLNIVLFANLVAAVYGGFIAFVKLEQISDALYSPRNVD